MGLRGERGHVALHPLHECPAVTSGGALGRQVLCLETLVFRKRRPAGGHSGAARTGRLNRRWCNVRLLCVFLVYFHLDFHLNFLGMDFAWGGGLSTLGAGPAGGRLRGLGGVGGGVVAGQRVLVLGVRHKDDGDTAVLGVEAGVALDAAVLAAVAASALTPRQTTTSVLSSGKLPPEVAQCPPLAF